MWKTVSIDGRDYLVDRDAFELEGEIGVGRQFESGGRMRRHAVTIRDDKQMSDRDAVIAVKPLLDCWEEIERAGD